MKKLTNDGGCCGGGCQNPIRVLHLEGVGHLIVSQIERPNFKKLIHVIPALPAPNKSYNQWLGDVQAISFYLRSMFGHGGQIRFQRPATA